MGKKGTPKLLYKASRDGFNSSVLWEKCLGQKETITLVQTNFSTVIGGYNPDQWEDTTGMRSSDFYTGCKDITSGSPFLFYWVRDKIQIIKHRDDQIPIMSSDKDWLMEFYWGLNIDAVKNENSLAIAQNIHWVHPEDTGNLTSEDGALFIAGGDNWFFKAVDVEVWGLH